MGVVGESGGAQILSNSGKTARSPAYADSFSTSAMLFFQDAYVKVFSFWLILHTPKKASANIVRICPYGAVISERH